MKHPDEEHLAPALGEEGDSEFTEPLATAASFALPEPEDRPSPFPESSIWGLVVGAIVLVVLPLMVVPEVAETVEPLRVVDRSSSRGMQISMAMMARVNPARATGAKGTTGARSMAMGSRAIALGSRSLRGQR